MTGNKIVLEDIESIINKGNNWHKFSGKSILITGANGFLPAYMVETLLILSAKGIIKDVKVFALVRNMNKAAERFRAYLNYSNLKFIVQDVCDPITIKEEIHFIIHAASQASPKFYGTDPVGTLSANVIGTINLFKFAQNQQ